MADKPKKRSPFEGPEMVLSPDENGVWMWRLVDCEDYPLAPASARGYFEYLYLMGVHSQDYAKEPGT